MLANASDPFIRITECNLCPVVLLIRVRMMGIERHSIPFRLDDGRAR